MSEEHGYTADSIVVIHGLEAVRRRPGMYIGSPDAYGLHYMVWEVVANSLDVWAGGSAEHIRVDIDGQTLEVEDDGPGIAPDARLIERILATLHAGATLDGHQPHFHLSPESGLGLAPINALSSDFTLETRHGGGHYRTRYARGHLVQPLTRVGDSQRTGVKVHLEADAQIFGDSAFDLGMIRQRLDPVLRMAAGLRLDLCGARYVYEDGLAGWVAERAGLELGEVIAGRGASDGVSVDVAFAWPMGGRSDIESFVGFQPTKDGGMHERGLFLALADALGSSPGVAREGLVARLHVCMLDPRFGPPTRDRLTDPAARAAVRSVVAEALSTPGGKAAVRRRRRG